MKNYKKHSKKTARKTFSRFLTPLFWFFVGVFFAFFCLSTFLLLYFKIKYHSLTIPGVFIGSVYVGEKRLEDVKKIFNDKNKKIAVAKLTFTLDENTATVSAQDLGIGYNSELISKQAISVGKSNDIISNIYHISNSYLNGVELSPSFNSDPQNIEKLLIPMEEKIHKDPVDALFTIENSKVTAFRESENGKTIDFEKLEKEIKRVTPEIIAGDKNILINVSLKTLEPKISTQDANNLGIVEEIGEGTSLFYHSIPGRIHNVVLAASRINGVLVAPDEEFSFNKNLGDVSQYTGYKQAYIIANGKTVLGDGGGVCQVSTTLFRAILNSGLPVSERSAHAYRVGYYEEGSPPGLDATVYYPTVDLKFKNDTGNYILIVANTDLNNLRLTFTLYGTSDGRQTTLTTPIVTNVAFAPPDKYEDDPTLPAGQTKQVDFAANGATVKFSRTVTRNGKTLIRETYTSVYRPWQAVFLKGTKQG